MEKKENHMESQDLKSLTIRIPISQYQKLMKIKKVTGLSMNGACIEALRRGIKIKLTEIEGEA